MSGVTYARGALGHAALAYAARGTLVFPLWWVDCNGVCACSHGAACSKPGKHPRTRNGVDDACDDPEQVGTWWTRWPYANIGLPAHTNRYAVLDVDPRHGGNEALDTLDRWCLARGLDLTATFTVRTGSGGLHRYYLEPPGGIKSTARAFGVDGLDTRGRGGYVVAPPSLHACGGRYEVISEPGTPLMAWPDVLTRLMDYKAAVAPAAQTGPPPARPAAATNAERWARAGLAQECERLRAITPGGRNDALNGSAYKVGRRVGAGYISANEAAAALLDAARGWQDFPEHEARATITSGLRAGMARPHPGPARGSA
jgi:hypothetical protein